MEHRPQSEALSAGYGQRFQCPLSFAQQRLWFLGQVGGLNASYHLTLGVRLEGDLDRRSLRRALGEIVSRHEVLRTKFGFVDGRPVQRIASIEESSFLLIEEDLFECGDAESELNRLVALEAETPFDLETGPLIRGRLIGLSEREAAFLVTAHHIVSDAWSMSVLADELSALYCAFRHGAENPLPGLTTQYADYAVWQRQWVEGEILQQQAKYWKTSLAGVPALLEIPTDHPRPMQQSFVGSFADLVLDEKLTESLKDLSRRHGTTLFMTLLAAWAALLARLSGQQDIVIGSPVANRERAEIETLIGLFVNVVAVRLDLSGSLTVANLLSQTKAKVVAAQQHCEIPFEQVVEIIRPVRSLAYTPLFQVAFAWQNAPQRLPEMAGLRLKLLNPAPRNTSKLDLLLDLHEEFGTIAGGVEYSTSLFTGATIERYLGYFRNLLEAIVTDDTLVLDRIALLSHSERNRLLFLWNNTDANFPTEQCVHKHIEQQVFRHPDAIALTFGESNLTYADLNRQANQVAHYLVAAGVRCEDRVAVCFQRSFQMIVAILGVLKAGAAYVPLEPEQPRERLRFMLKDASPVVVLAQDSLKGLFTIDICEVPVFTVDQIISSTNEYPSANPNICTKNLAYVIYTSGSTGLPKGVMVQHLSLVNRLFWMQRAYALTEGEAILQKTPFSFDVSVWEFFWPLMFGARLVIACPDGHKDPKYLIATIHRNHITTVHFVPSMLPLFLEEVGTGDVPSLRRIVCSGEGLSCTQASTVREKIPQASLHNLYGPTEATVDVTAWTLPANMAFSVVPIGRAIANVKIYILDHGLQPVPQGTTGEIYIGGLGLARGYLNRPTLTASRFLADPFADQPNARMYRTGDLGRWLSDGHIEFLGRNDFQIKIRGFRVELSEIESSLLSHPTIRNAAVLPRLLKNGERQLVAFYATMETPNLICSGQELRKYLSSVLPDYMIPAKYVHLDSLPLTSSGKLNRLALSELRMDLSSESEYEPPRGGMESLVARIWADVLSLERVGRTDNFYELGGHSLSIIQIATRLRSILNVNIPIRSLFDTTTIIDMTNAIVIAQLAQDSPDEMMREIRELSELEPEHVRQLCQEELKS